VPDERPSLDVGAGSRRIAIALVYLVLVLVAALYGVGSYVRLHYWLQVVFAIPALRASPDLASSAYLTLQISSAVVTIGAYVFALAYIDRRLGRATFFADRLELEKYLLTSSWRFAPARHVLAWSEVAGFRDRARSHIGIVRRNSRFLDGYRLTIPTPDDASREKVVVELERRGIARVG
jgi:hypothetical protein